MNPVFIIPIIIAIAFVIFVVTRKKKNDVKENNTPVAPKPVPHVFPQLETAINHVINNIVIPAIPEHMEVLEHSYEYLTDSAIVLRVTISYPPLKPVASNLIMASISSKLPYEQIIDVVPTYVLKV